MEDLPAVFSLVPLIVQIFTGETLGTNIINVQLQFNSNIAHSALLHSNGRFVDSLPGIGDVGVFTVLDFREARFWAT